MTNSSTVNSVGMTVRSDFVWKEMAVGYNFFGKTLDL